MTLTPIPIEPMSYGLEQRTEASKRATQLGAGLRMELGNVTTRYYADPEVAIGQIAVYMPKEYKGWPEYTETLSAPDAVWAWEVARASELAEWLGRTSSSSEATHE